MIHIYQNITVRLKLLTWYVYVNCYWNAWLYIFISNVKRKHFLSILKTYKWVVFQYPKVKKWNQINLHLSKGRYYTMNFLTLNDYFSAKIIYILLIIVDQHTTYSLLNNICLLLCHPLVLIVDLYARYKMYRLLLNVCIQEGKQILKLTIL